MGYKFVKPKIRPKPYVSQKNPFVDLDQTIVKPK